MKLLKCGMACCVFLSVVAWQTKDTSLQPTDTGGFIVEIQKKYAEVQAVKKKGNQEEIENKIKAVHRRLTRTYPVYYDWWLQDGTTGDVDWFDKSLNQELSVRLQKLNIKASASVWQPSQPINRRLFLQSTELCALLSLLIPKVFRMPVPNVITLRAARWQR